MRMTYSYNKNKIMPSSIMVQSIIQPTISFQSEQTTSEIVQLSNNFNGMISRISNAKTGCSSCGK